MALSKGDVGTCPVCKVVFIAQRRNQKSCSTVCSNELWKIRARAITPPKKRLKNGEPSPIRIEGDTAFIWLMEGYEAAVDVADLPLVEGRRWRRTVAPYGNTYAVTGYTIHGTFVTLHRLLLQPPKDVIVDHKDGDGLNNRRCNIRNANHTQNNQNRAAAQRNRLQLKGVTRTAGTKNRYTAKIRKDGEIITLGSFATPEEAAAAYKGAAKVIQGDFAYE